MYPYFYFFADMDKTLSKLDIGPRSALILIGSDNPTGNPSHSRASADSDAGSSSQSEATTTGGSYVGKFFSFLSPYVYGRAAAAPQGQQNSSSASHNSKFPKPLLKIFVCTFQLFLYACKFF
jgi:hypothetical protein